MVVANWKMHGSTEFAAEIISTIASALSAINLNSAVVLCPPYVYLHEIKRAIGGSVLELGAQDVDYRAQGAVTGGIAADMLRDVGCDYVIIGHSERRQLFAESDALVAQKFVAVAAAGLMPIVCVGETKEERDAGQTLQVVARQVRSVLDVIDVDLGSQGFILAYEPIWAIGTGEVATPEQAQEVHAHLRGIVPEGTRILYGGSVKANNAAALIQQQDIDGFLVGGASLKAEEFVNIIVNIGVEG
ncbi:MAG: triose-phosphate isomerase [Legionellales bacterium]|nr:MAG: triose-phosphate isomerase [Legionellales bacterium]